MRLHRQTASVAFALAGQDIPRNESGERYSLWLTEQDGERAVARRRRSRVGENGQLHRPGRANEDLDEFPSGSQLQTGRGLTQDDDGERQGARQGHPQRRPPAARLGASSLPGFMIPAGSSAP